MPTAASSDGPSRPRRPERRLERPRDGRWLAGVCVALARYSGRRVGMTRLAFVLTIPFFGLPLVAYLVWWLILPEEGGRERPRGSLLFSGVASVLLAFGGGLALLTLAAAGAVATVFGLGWGVFIVAAGTLAIGAIWMREVNPGWMLLPLAALVLPAAVIAGLHTHLDRQIGDTTVAPRSRSELASRDYRIGVGTLLIDLRHYDWSDAASVPLEVSGGVGRTIVALPEHRCVAVRVHYDTHAGVLHGIAHALGLDGNESTGLTVFGHSFPGGQGVVPQTADGNVPTLSVDFSSEGGELFVRDYPNSLDPPENPDWPDFYPVGHLNRHGLSKAKLRKQERINRHLARRLIGPCADARRR